MIYCEQQVPGSLSAAAAFGRLVEQDKNRMGSRAMSAASDSISDLRMQGAIVTGLHACRVEGKGNWIAHHQRDSTTAASLSQAMITISHKQCMHLPKDSAKELV